MHLNILCKKCINYGDSSQYYVDLLYNNFDIVIPPPWILQTSLDETFLIQLVVQLVLEILG